MAADVAQHLKRLTKREAVTRVKALQVRCFPHAALLPAGAYHQCTKSACSAADAGWGVHAHRRCGSCCRIRATSRWRASCRSGRTCSRAWSWTMTAACARPRRTSCTCSHRCRPVSAGVTPVLGPAHAPHWITEPKLMQGLAFQRVGCAVAFIVAACHVSGRFKCEVVDCSGQSGSWRHFCGCCCRHGGWRAQTCTPTRHQQRRQPCRLRSRVPSSARRSCSAVLR